MFNLSTKQIAQALNGQLLNFDFNKNSYVNSVVSNHTQVQKNSIFVAIKGKKFDGHNFVKQAIQRGACFAIVEKKLPNTPQIVVKNTKNALLKIAELNRLQFYGPVVAVTGSFGKTTTKDLIAQILSTTKQVVKTQKNLNNEIGVAQTLLNLNPNNTAAVVELGMAHENEISQLSNAAKPTVGVITGIGSAHFQNFNSIDKILKAKLEIMDGMPKNAKIIYNADSEKLKSNFFKNHPAISCAIKNPKADFYASKIVSNLNSTNFTAVFNNTQAEFELPLIGEFNVLDALFAIAIGTQFKIEIKNMQKALKTFKTTGLRQKLIQFNSINIIADCYNASPETVTAALKVFSKRPCKGRKIAVLGDMLSLGNIAKNEHEKIGKLIDNLEIDEIICLGELSKVIYLNTKKPAHHFESASELIKFMKNKVKSNDLILFKASHDMNFENIINQIFSNVLQNTT